MASFPISTPSPPARVHTPGSPKFGYNDSWEPYTPRKSARISAQRATHRTPSPRASSQRRSRLPTKPAFDASTPIASPQKKRQPAMDSVRRAPGVFSAQGSSATKPYEAGSSQHKSKPSTTTSRSAAMLPTPAKTPQKEPDEKMKANVRAVARNLFSEPETTPTLKRKAKKYSGLTLDSFTAEEINDPIEIFTDSRDRVPEVDNADENPFYGDYVATPVQTRSRAKQVSIPGEGRQDMDEVLEREDGIVYVFRGKKIFRKFSSGEDAETTSQADEEGLDAEFGTAASRKRLRPVTRSSIKPRLLFPSVQKKGKQPANTAAEDEDDDEEAVTDIEEHILEDLEEDQLEEPATPVKRVEKKPSTPTAPRFAPSSPPSTVRTTRTTSKLHTDDATPKPPKSHNPFDGWRRSKSRAAPHGQKREGEALTGPHEVSKRQRA